jgi:hypothetical protein
LLVRIEEVVCSGEGEGEGERRIRMNIHDTI